MVGLLTGSVGSIPTLVCFTIGRVGRAAEGTGLLNRHTGNCVVSSNLTLSAKTVAVDSKWSVAYNSCIVRNYSSLTIPVEYEPEKAPY